ncbi:AraC family transcriptional regulator [Hydrogenophaga sp. 5NK40-0174]|uniref:AraC family transcriptional regulator n=1 Tax=Hydrogenophaga sp. 5NK40-0174 TaxID=3127649 RepID=UPI0033415EF7
MPIVADSSKIALSKHADASSTANAVDRLSSLLERFRVHAHLFHHGPLCGVTTFAAEPGRAFLHVLRRGEMLVSHRTRSGAPRKLQVSQPSLLFYPRPLYHAFHNAPEEGSDLVCATLSFDGGAQHPLVLALPPVVVVPVDAVESIGKTLDLLFAETDKVRCGQRLLADRLFEVLLLQMLRWMLDHGPEVGVDSGLLAGLSSPKLARALTALHDRPGDAWPLERLAAVAGMSRSAFAAEFKDAVGVTPGEYLVRWRVSVAQTQLRSGFPVKAVSDELGYASPAAFSRAFTKVAGVSPMQWVRSIAPTTPLVKVPK